MINKPQRNTVSESTAMSFIPRQIAGTTGMNMSVENNLEEGLGGKKSEKHGLAPFSICLAK